MRSRSFIIAAIFCLSVGIQQARPQEIPRPFLEFTDHPGLIRYSNRLRPKKGYVSSYGLRPELKVISGRP